jgi:hypothetical protein
MCKSREISAFSHFRGSLPILREYWHVSGHVQPDVMHRMVSGIRIPSSRSQPGMAATNCSKILLMATQSRNKISEATPEV